MPMKSHFQRDMVRLERDILYLGSLVEQATNKAILALTARRPELAEALIAADDEIDAREVQIEDECLKVLALHQPVAGDLRFIVAVSKIDNELERIGDLSANICARVIELSQHTYVSLPTGMLVMAERIEAMLATTLDALIDSDAGLARKVLCDDKEVDELFARLVLELKEEIRAHIDLLDSLIVIFSVARYLERLADRMTNICEDVIYMAEGEIVRHQDPSASAVDMQLERERNGGAAC
jgi:phosphate transport system protein